MDLKIKTPSGVCIIRQVKPAEYAVLREVKGGNVRTPVKDKGKRRGRNL